MNDVFDMHYALAMRRLEAHKPKSSVRMKRAAILWALGCALVVELVVALTAWPVLEELYGPGVTNPVLCIPLAAVGGALVWAVAYRYFASQFYRLDTDQISSITRDCDAYPEIAPAIARWRKQVGELRGIEYDLVQLVVADLRSARIRHEAGGKRAEAYAALDGRLGGDPS